MNSSRFSSAALLVGLSLAAAAGTATAQADPDRAVGKREALQQRFAAADTNGDGRLSREEAKAKMPMVFKHFDEIDTAHAGSVTLADIAAFAKAHRKTAQ